MLNFHRNGNRSVAAAAAAPPPPQLSWLGSHPTTTSMYDNYAELQQVNEARNQALYGASRNVGA
jgi:hypothetical protein